MTQSPGTAVNADLAPPSLWARYGLVLAIALSTPMIFLVMTTLVAALTPGGPCADCPIPDTPPALSADLQGPARAEADVRRWVEHTAALAPHFASEPVLFDWQRPLDVDQPPRRSLLELAADDMQARYAFALPIVLLVLISVPVGVTAIVLMRRAPLFWQAGALGLGVIGALVSWNFEDSHPVRLFVAEHLLGLAALAGAEDGAAYPMIQPETWVLAFRAVDIATVMAVTSSTLAFAMFAWLAVADPGGPGAGIRIKRRAQAFKLMLALGSLVLILAVASAYELMNWSAVLLAPHTRAAVDSLASSAGLFWGALYSLVLAGMAVPAAVSIQIDLHRLAEAPDAPPLADLSKEVGFQFDIRQTITTVLTLAGPLLTAPVLELLKVLAPAV